MSFLKRRKSPNPLNFSVRKKIVPKPIKKRPVRKVVKIVKIVKIVNPISQNKINLGGPTHLRLIKEKVLDGSGKDIRKEITTKPQAPKATKQFQIYTKKALSNYSFDLSKRKVCSTFTESDFELLIKNPNIKKQSLFKCAVGKGYLSAVKELLKDERVNPSAHNNMAIISASDSGYLNIVKELLKDPRVNPGDDHNFALRTASENGFYLIVKELLKDPKVNANDVPSINIAARNGHLNVIKEFIKNKRVTQKTLDSAIFTASQSGNRNIVKELLKN